MNVTSEGIQIVTGERQTNYGPPWVNFARITGMLNALGYRFVDGAGVQRDLIPEDYPAIMICTKVAREANRHTDDNLVDICGYVETLKQVIEHRKKMVSPEDDGVDASFTGGDATAATVAGLTGSRDCVTKAEVDEAARFTEAYVSRFAPSPAVCTLRDAVLNAPSPKNVSYASAHEELTIGRQRVVAAEQGVYPAPRTKTEEAHPEDQVVLALIRDGDLNSEAWGLWNEI